MYHSLVRNDISSYIMNIMNIMNILDKTDFSVLCLFL